ncbi:MAG: hypothetical protein A2637_06275 [Candidatus Muproteobacteria bacterium RIFCSPHIGHO2_01_FULL_65_16]|uniref:Lipoprotein LPP20-like domain-containing protein n=1 Tax=Candidatus Muproteobacteria bacterium RIFCSPHIGHO2_01_FULL_65_16 TaxID=1817764 RepID=A0A1F6TP64_9PROT|nr:MAG: hypothetical protein A2637_06275 [Candidatus Muproteobacteria bacterium RIFCSPHIGHO2_01_FULL_65_16]
MKTKHALQSFPLVAVAAMIAACAGPTRLESDIGVKGAPDWVNKGTAYVNDKGGRLFHGVGAAAPMGDPSLQRATADDRARAEVARIFSSYLDVVSNDYQAAAKSGGAAASEESVSRQIKNFTQVNLAGARIIARWQDKKTGTVYAIAELDAKGMKDTLGLAREMNEDMRRYIRDNADNIFDRVTKEKSP